MARLEGTVAIVTGGGTGIGLGIARAFAREGAKVTLTGRRASVLERAALELGGEGAALAVAGDVSRSSDCESVVAATVERFGTLSVVVNNAGVATPGPLAELAESDVHSMVDIDVKGPIFLARAALGALEAHAAEHGDASILNISSSVTFHALPNYSVYSASKAALDMLTRCWARELGPKRVRANAICPGIVETPVFETMMPKESVPAFLASFDEQVPLGRVGQPADIAETAVHLSSSAGSWITGAVIPVDGGLSLAS